MPAIVYKLILNCSLLFKYFIGKPSAEPNFNKTKPKDVVSTYKGKIIFDILDHCTRNLAKGKIVQFL